MINALAWSHNNQIVASGANDGQIVLSSAQTGKKVHAISAQEKSLVPGGTQYLMGAAPVTSLTFSKTSEFLCAGLGDGQSKIWNLHSKRLAANMMQPAQARFMGSDYGASPITSVTLNSNN